MYQNVHVAVYIPQEPQQQKIKSLGHICGVATIACVNKGNSQNTKAIMPYYQFGSHFL